jgi:biopolymer transport protein ExbD
MNLQIKRRKSRIELVPMIDVLFFMLVFFMLFSTINGSQTGVPVQLPKALHLGDAANNSLVISITADAQLYLGKQLLGLSALRQQVGLQIKNDPATQVIVRPDAAVSYQEIVKVMDALASIGVEKPLLGVDRQQIPNAAKLNLNSQN